MAFTYAPALSDDVSLVRFHVGDNVDRGHYLEDEEIQYFITAADVGTAVLNCIRHIIAKLSAPDFTKDWMSVSSGEARKGFERLLELKASEFGISLSGFTFTSSISLPSRADSYMEDGTQDGLP